MKNTNNTLLRDKKVIITGGSQGIGKGIAMAMAHAGADILIQYNRSAEAANKLCSKLKELNQSAHVLQADFTNANDVKSFITKCIDILGGVDVLVNCAAAYDTKPLLDITADDIRLMHLVNVEVLLTLTQTFARYCIEKQKTGSIINVSSIGGEMPSVNSALLSCSKASLNMLTKSSALELAPYNIRVNAIAPGMVDTESNASFKDNDPEGWAKAIEEIPLNRVGQPSDCGELAAFLASDNASWMTGAIIPIDGGMTISWRS